MAKKKAAKKSAAALAKKARRLKRQPLAFDPSQIENTADNEPHIYSGLVHHIRQIRNLVNDAARRAAKFNQEWHDDTTAEDHADFQRPWDEQFPIEARNIATRSLVNRYLIEFELGNYDRSEPT